MKPETLPYPAFWKTTPEPLSTAAGMHRWIWDLQCKPVETGVRMDDDELFSAARGVIALPGAYTVKMTVAGQTFSQPLNVKMDPRVKTSAADLQKQFDEATAVASSQSEIADTQREVQQLLRSAREVRSQAQNSAALATALDALIQKADDIAGPPPGPYGIVPSKAGERRAGIVVARRQIRANFFCREQWRRRADH